jgi:hypothetical protein
MWILISPSIWQTNLQTIHWGQTTSKAKLLPDPCGRDALHGFEVYLTRMGTQSGPAFEGFLKKDLKQVCTVLLLGNIQILNAYLQRVTFVEDLNEN